ncbi:conserved hypothetical protein [Ixodes scapularis]|uniref:Uncharacterized protein n=1 Tax=Ixodes scapularis TaxID=6945 RepID=B7P8M7_IXOSC|nr:conserved hypothetical protein [Ixodes scapularis]|eukprot:XP_002402510.1 conserved hypothetical protein [Ixodes scapularis]
MRNKKLLDIKQETLVKNMGILKALFPLKDILKHPEILSFQFGTAEQRYHNLEEMGVKTVTPGKVIVSNGFVLLAHPNNLENLLCQVRHLAGMDVRQLGNLCPRLLTVPSENVVRVERLLHQYGISQAQAARCIGIYGLSPATIAARLQELDKVAEFQVRKECPRILNLVYYASKAKHRLELLSHLGYEAGVSMHVLSMGSKDFARVFYSGSDRGRSQETVEFLSKLLNRDEVEVKERLAHHPCSTLVSLLNARRVVDFLLAKGVSKEQLWYGIQA